MSVNRNKFLIRLGGRGLVITTAAAHSGAVGVAFSLTLAASRPVETWVKLSGSNFTLNGGVLSMTDVSAAGAFTAQVRATDYTGATATATFVVTLTGVAGLGQVANLSVASTTASLITLAFDSLASATYYEAGVDSDLSRPRTLTASKQIGVSRPGADYIVQVRGRNTTDTGAWSAQVTATAAELTDPGPAIVTQAVRAHTVTDAHVLQLNLNYATSTMPFYYYGNSTGTLTSGAFQAGGWVKDHVEPLVNVGLKYYRSLPGGHNSASSVGAVVARNLYGTYGLKMHATMNYNTFDATSVTTVMNNIRNAGKGNFASAIASFAGLNEPNDPTKSTSYPAGTDWRDEVIAHHLAIEAGLGNAAYSTVEHHSFSPWGRRGYDTLLDYFTAAGKNWHRDVAPLLDKLNLHYYTGGRRPEIAGAPTGADEGGTPLSEVSLDWTMTDYTAYLLNSGQSLPFAMTEMGWGRLNADTTTPYVSIDTARKYQQRMTFENLLRGISFTVWFQTFQTDTTMQWQMIDHAIAGGVCTFTRNSVYTTFLNTMTAFYDNGATARTFSPGSLAFTLADGTASPGAYDQRIHHLLTQKSDGKFYLALWYEKDSWNRNTKAESFGSRLIKLGLPSAMAVATNRPYTNTTFTAQGSVSTIDLTVNDDVLVVRIG